MRSRRSSTNGVKKNKVMKNDESVRNLAPTTVRSQSLLLKYANNIMQSKFNDFHFENGIFLLAKVIS